jgi:hypothetical protein
MRSRALLMSVCLAVAVPMSAQQSPPPRGGTPAPPQSPRPGGPNTGPATVPAPIPPPRREGQPVNVKIEFILVDQHGSGAPTKRSVSLVVADMRGGSIRSTSDVMGVGGGVPLNIDTNPELLPDGKIRLGFTIQYDWPAPIESGESRPAPPRGTVIKTSMHESVALILDSGKSMIAAQSADPLGDRTVTVEVKATVLK